MKPAQWILEYKRIFFTIFATASILGILFWMNMPKEEDPRLKERFGNIQIIAPGYSVNEIDRLVASPLFDELAEIDEVKETEATLRQEFMIVNVGLKDSVSTDPKIDEAWKRVENAVRDAQKKWPSAVLPGVVNRHVLDQDAIVLGVSHPSSMVLIEKIRILEDRLLKTASVSRVRQFGESEEEIRISLNDQVLTEKGLSRLQLLSQLQQNNISLPAGSMKVAGKKLNVSTNSFFTSLDDISEFPIIAESGQIFELQELADIERSLKSPRTELVRRNQKNIVAIGVVPQKNIDLIEFGKSVQQTIDRFQKDHSSVQMEVISFQPKNVETRLADLSQSLLSGILIVALVVFLTMGFRIGLLTAALVPIISLVALAIYAMQGGSLNQISIAAFVLSLGLVVDNLIVVLESVQRHLDEGKSAQAAAKTSIAQLSIPLLAATGTTLASFFPMLGSVGTTADFTRSIPWIAVLTLSISFLFCVFITPALGELFLKPSAKNKKDLFRSWGELVGSWSLRFPWITVGAFVVLLFVSLSFFPKIPFQFFPSADRNILVMDIRMPEGTHIDQTAQTSQSVEKIIAEMNGVTNVTAFVGRSTPLFFYNLQRVPNASHVAQLMIEFEDFEKAAQSLELTRAKASQVAPEALIVTRKLAQGPPVDAPIEIRVFGDDRKAAGEYSEKLVAAMRNVQGAHSVRHNYGTGIAVQKWQIQDAAARQLQTNRAQITQHILSLTLGARVGDFLANEDSIPIILTSPQGEQWNVPELMQSGIFETTNRTVQLGELVHDDVQFEPSILTYFNFQPVVTILSEVDASRGTQKVQGDLLSLLAQDKELATPDGVRWEFGGASAESDTANRAILTAMPLGVLLLLVSLLFQFNSFRSVTTIVLCVPLALLGVFPGLFFLKQSFGFFSILALLALIGIVVNNGILILDAIQVFQKEGHSLPEAIQQAVAQRMRPIWVTTLTTVAGLLPLALTRATLWPPFAWTLIFGLLAAAMFSPLLVPSVYFLMRRERKKSRGPILSLFVSMGLISPSAMGMSLDEFVSALQNRNRSVQAETLSLKSVEAESDTAFRKAFYPKVSLTFLQYENDRPLENETPFGAIEFQQQRQGQLGLQLQQPLWNSVTMRHQQNIVDQNVKRQQVQRDWTEDQMVFSGVHSYLQVLDLKIRKQSLEKQVALLKSRKKEVQRLYDLGRVSSLDLIKIDVAVRDVQVAIERLRADIETIEDRLAEMAQLDNVQAEDFQFQAFIQKWNTVKVMPRADITLREIQDTTLRKQYKMVNAEWVPEVYLGLQWNQTQPSVFEEERWWTASIQARWNLFDSGSRNSRKREILQKQKAVQVQKDMLKDDISLATQKARREEKLAVYAQKQHQESQKLAETASVEEWKRYRLGKSTVNDVIDADELLRQSQQNLQLSEIEIWKKQWDLTFHQGKI